MIHFYVIFAPSEALIASQLGPKDFGMYMAQGSKKGSAEQLMFARSMGDSGSISTGIMQRRNVSVTRTDD